MIPQENVNKFPLVIKETNLDLYRHVNNATYLTFYEEARWDLINRNGYGFSKILETGQGPVVLEVTIRYLKELRLHDEIIIETTMGAYEKKTGKMYQRMMRGDDVCSTADFIFGLFDLNERKLILPTPEWLRAVGL